MARIAAGLYVGTAGSAGRIRIQRAPDGTLEGVSGDVTRRDGLVLSFLLDRMDVVDTEETIGGQAVLFPSEDGHAATVPQATALSLTAVASGRGAPRIEARLRLGNGDTALTLVRDGDALRQLSLVLDAVPGVPVPDSSLLDGGDGEEGLRSVLAKASIAADLGAGIRPPPGAGAAFGTDGTLNLAELHDVLRDWGRPPASGDLSPWWLHVLFAGQLAGDKTVLGMMYDTQRDATRPRQGLAVFLNSTPIAEGSVPHSLAWRKKVLFTLVHEIGHGLNLPHCFDRSEDWKGILSWMNYPEKFNDGEAGFWSLFKNTFDRDELNYICHAPQIDIAPGGSEYATRLSDLLTGGIGGAGPMLAAPTSRIAAAAALAPVKTRAIYAFGEPVYLRFTLTNTGTRSFLYPKSFDPTDGLLQIEITRPDGRARSIRPALALCKRHRMKRLRPGDSAAFDGIFASFDADGPVFESPGRYTLAARFTGLPGRALTTPRTSLYVLHPTRAEEHAAINIWSDPQLMRAIYLRQPLLALEPWRAAVAAYERLGAEGADPDDTTTAFLSYIGAVGWMQRFAPASRADAHGPDLDRAERGLRACQHDQLPSGVGLKLKRLPSLRRRGAEAATAP